MLSGPSKEGSDLDRSVKGRRIDRSRWKGLTLAKDIVDLVGPRPVHHLKVDEPTRPHPTAVSQLFEQLAYLLLVARPSTDVSTR